MAFPEGLSRTFPRLGTDGRRPWELELGKQALQLQGDTWTVQGCPEDSRGVSRGRWQLLGATTWNWIFCSWYWKIQITRLIKFMIEVGFYNVWMELFECNYDTMKIILHTRDQPNTTGEENERNLTRRLSPSHGLMTIQSLKQLQTHIFWGVLFASKRITWLYTSAILSITCHRQTSPNPHSICLKSKEFSASLSGSTWLNPTSSIATGYTGLGLHAVQEDIPNSHQSVKWAKDG